jgi:hypothetical protein
MEYTVDVIKHKKGAINEHQKKFLLLLTSSQQLVHRWVRGTYEFCHGINMSVGQ